MARDLKIRIFEVEGLYYLCGENKGADQLRCYREADLRLCFHMCKKPVFSQCGSYYEAIKQKPTIQVTLIMSIETGQKNVPGNVNQLGIDRS